MESLLRSRQFWLAAVAVAQVVIFQSVPNFPDAIWQAIFALLMVVIVKLTIDDTGKALARTLITAMLETQGLAGFTETQGLITRALAAWRG